ncbi:MAG: amidohydrolase 2 [Subtercola sp.]|jgi:predicted TIM-barrel fold metal-dependent hydrolase|nr:amidohydrolase 2 [Subtercola sp.]
MTRRIIDAHAHIGRTISSDVGQDVETWLGTMNAAGISQSILSVAAGGLQADGLVDTRRANDVIAKAVSSSSDRFPIGLASIEVRHGEAALAEVSRAFDIGLSGLAFHATFEGFSVDSAAFLAVLDRIGDRPALVLIHSTPDAKASPQAIGTVAARYPQLEIVLGHPVFTEAQRAGAVEVLAAHPNLNLDIAYQDDPATTEYFVRELGADRVLFGSDAPFFEPGRVIDSIERASLTESDRAAIFAGNAERLIGAVR